MPGKTKPLSKKRLKKNPSEDDVKRAGKRLEKDLEEFVQDSKSGSVNGSYLMDKQKKLLQRLIRFAKHNKYKLMMGALVTASAIAGFKKASFAMDLKAAGVDANKAMRNTIYHRLKDDAAGALNTGGQLSMLARMWVALDSALFVTGPSLPRWMKYLAVASLHTDAQREYGFPLKKNQKIDKPQQQAKTFTAKTPGPWMGNRYLKL